MPEKVEWLRENGLWQEVRDYYIEKKNRNANPEKHSRSIYAETIVDLLMDKNKGRLTDKQYERETQLLKFQIDELNLKKEVILNEQGKIQLAEYRAEVVTDLLKTGKILDEFDKTIFKSLVHKIKVIGGKEIEIEFECGIKVTEKL